jgi:UDP-N-acetylglucosamine--N-acetylmuramyl-(pentapeptide) pyrophosphoryl-undecaprenol N-acetylglucosamine transferase
MADARPVVLAAGGTGGHVFPAQALAEELLRRGHALALVTDRRGTEYGDALGRIETFRISAAGFGDGLMGKLRGLLRLAAGFLQARRVLSRLRPGAVVGFGGYPTLPTMIAACRAGLPTLIHEQNAVLGRANAFLAPRVGRIATSFASVAGIRDRDRKRAVQTGNPVRAAIAELRDRPYAGPRGREFTVLVLGGSQGARVLSDVVPAALALLPDAARGRVQVVQQCRTEDIERVRLAYWGHDIMAELATFFGDVPDRLAAAHVVICRAGASTVAELVEAGRPAVLVPYRYATDDHQRANASALADAGGGWMMVEDDFTPEALATRMEELIGDPERLRHAAECCASLRRGAAASLLADEVEILLGARREREEAA